MGDKDQFGWLGRFLTATEMEQLDHVVVPVSDSHSFTLAELLEGWHAHIRKIEADLPLSDDDRTIWGVYDLIAALTIRSTIARGVAAFGTVRPEGMDRALRSVDATYSKMTESDTSEILLALDDTGRRPTDEWWWNRIPQSGPIRREIDEIRASLPEPDLGRELLP